MLNARKAAAANATTTTPAAAAPAAKAPKAAAAAKPVTKKKKTSQLAAASAYKDKAVAVDAEGKPIISRVFDSKNSAAAYTSEGESVISAKELTRLVAAETKFIFGTQLRPGVVQEILNALQMTILKATADGKKVKTLLATFEGVDKAARDAHNPQDPKKKIHVPAHRVVKVKVNAAAKAFVKGAKN